MRASIFLASLLVLAPAAQAATVFGVDQQNNLVTFDSMAPGAFTSSTAITGAGSPIIGLDFRPLNGQLFGFGTDQVIYAINAVTGAASAVSGPLGSLSGSFGFDFNPTIDRLRIVSASNDNFVFNPNDGSVTTTTPVFFGPGDANQGDDPDVVALAYTSSVFGAPGSSTQLYALDAAQGLLATQANSLGTLGTVGPAGVNFSTLAGFDISGGDAFAIDGNDLYSVNLGTGAFTSLGTTSRRVTAIAIAPIPEPSTWAMLLVGFGFMGAIVRSRRALVVARSA